jgi:hypothetical protein
MRQEMRREDMVGKSLTDICGRAGRVLKGALVLCLAVAASPAAASRDPATTCREAAAQVSRETGVPMSVLEAISLTETGRKKNGSFGSWPWTVNMEGAGRWFDSREEALAFAKEGFAQGKRSFDVGCFQLNYKWHGEAFSSIEEMFDPIANARYAAGFLSRLHGETGDWSLAAGAYHSRTPKYATRYRKIFDRHFASVAGGDGPVHANANDFSGQDDAELAAVADEPMRQNTYPLLIADAGQGQLGSLVPLGQTQNRLIPLQTARALQ